MLAEHLAGTLRKDVPLPRTALDDSLGDAVCVGWVYLSLGDLLGSGTRAAALPKVLV